MKGTIAHLVIAVCIAGLARADQTVHSVQQALKDQGFYYGNVTGDKSAETTAAIRRYQIRNGLQVTGEINPETLNSLNVSGKSKSVASSQSSSKPVVTQSNTARPDQIAPVAQSPPPQPPVAPDRQFEINSDFNGAAYAPPPRRVSKRMVVDLQRQLITRGYYRGRVDGRYGRQTALALREFQFGSGLLPTGRLDMSTLTALGLSNANLAYMQSAPRSREMWVPIPKFKHGKWKMKWKKLHRAEDAEYADEDRGEYDADWWHGEDRDD
jgi:peptidoglycan hydrolase-like protein with peptidoglycan-binding domain